MKELFWMMIGICIGTIFHRDIPVINKISGEKIKILLSEAVSEVSDKSDVIVDEIQTPPTKKEIRKNERRKKSRKDKDIIDSVGM
jgi:hypothetical protein